MLRPAKGQQEDLFFMPIILLVGMGTSIFREYYHALVPQQNTYLISSTRKKKTTLTSLANKLAVVKFLLTRFQYHLFGVEDSLHFNP